MASSTFFAVSGHAPDEVIKFLLKRNPEPSYHVLKSGDRLKENSRIRQKIILCLRQEDFILNYKVLKDLNKQVFVFGSPVFFLNYIGFHHLDFVVSDTDCSKISILDYLDSEVFDRSTPSYVQRHKETYFECVVEKAKSGSIFDKLMTFIYKLPAKTHQKPVKKLCCQYVRFNWSAKQLNSKFAELMSDIKIPQAIHEGILTILLSETAERYRQAFTNIHKESDVAGVAKQADLNPYEFMYILKMLEKDKNVANRSQVSVDTYLNNDKQVKLNAGKTTGRKTKTRQKLAA